MAIVKIHAELTRNKFHFRSDCELHSKVTGIFGPSGSGKTTFLHLLAGLQKPEKGNIQVNGHTLFNSDNKVFVPAHRRKVGYVFQEGRVFPHMNVERNLQYAMRKMEDSKSLFYEVVELLELKPFLNYMPHHLSGGQNQRVALGRALLSNSQLLLLDEPFTALDFTLKNQVITFINRIISHLDIPMIIVSHDLKDLLMLTQNLVLMNQGKTEPPETYLELIRKQKLLELNGLISNYYNIYDGTIAESDPSKGLAMVEMKNNPQLRLFIESDDTSLKKGVQIKLALRGADVALSSHRIDDISIRNQLEGTIESVFQHKNHMVCIVNCGIHIITRLTIESAKKLTLSPGKKTWCLFKSLAIETYR
ncbi:Spermidine/putrescine import ATP-binding protein PotA [subsurface metagenome]